MNTNYEFNVEMASSLFVSFSIFWGVLWVASIKRFETFFHDHNTKQSMTRLIQAWFAATTLFLWAYIVVVCKEWKDIPITVASLIAGTAVLMHLGKKKKDQK